MEISEINNRLLAIQEEHKAHFKDGYIRNHICEVQIKEGSDFDWSVQVSNDIPEYIAKKISKAVQLKETE